MLYLATFFGGMAALILQVVIGIAEEIAREKRN